MLMLDSSCISRKICASITLVIHTEQHSPGRTLLKKSLAPFSGANKPTWIIFSPCLEVNEFSVKLLR